MDMRNEPRIDGVIPSMFVLANIGVGMLWLLSGLAVYLVMGIVKLVRGSRRPAAT